MASHSIHPKNIGSDFICLIWGAIAICVLKGSVSSAQHPVSLTAVHFPEDTSVLLDKRFTSKPAVLGWSTHRQYLLHFPSLEFCLSHFPLAEMRGWIAIWNSYVNVNNNYSFYFYYGYHLGRWGASSLTRMNLQGDQWHLLIWVSWKRQTTIFLVWLKSSISQRLEVPEAHGWVTSPGPVNRETRSCVRLVFAAGLPAFPCQERTALAKGRKPLRKYVHRFLDGSKEACANPWLKRILLFGRNLDFCLKQILLGLTLRHNKLSTVFHKGQSSNCGWVGWA